MWRLQPLWELPLVRRVRPPRASAVRQAIATAGERVNLVAGLVAIAPLGVLYTDFSELVYAAGKAWLMTFVDHVSKVVPGWALGSQADTALALSAGRRRGAGSVGAACRSPG